MRALVDIVENITSSIRFIVGLFVLAMMVIGLLLSFGVSYAAPKAADSFAERAERITERAIAAEQQERLAEDGWGYRAAAASADPEAARAQGGEPAGDGWGD